MEARPLACFAMSVMGLVLVGTAGGQAPPSLEARAQAPPAYEDEGESVVGPTPGVATVSITVAVNRALEQNFGLLGAADAVQGARFRETAAAAQFHPRITPRYSRTNGVTDVGLDATQLVPWTGATIATSNTLRSLPLDTGAPGHSSDLRFTLTQPLLRGIGPTYTQYDLVNSRRALQGQERSFELSRQQLAVDVITAFYQVVKQRQLVQVSRQSLERSHSLAAASEARLEVGLASKLDVFRAQLQASQAEDSMVQSASAMDGALEQFRLLLGLDPSDVLEPEAVALPDPAEGEIEPVQVLITRALESRLELKELRDETSDARRGLTVARLNLLPQLDVGVSYLRLGFGTSYSDSLKAAEPQVLFSLATSYPLERASEEANKAVAELAVTASERNLRQRELQVESEVRAAVRSLERIRKSVELQRQGLDFAIQQQRLATLRYQRGLASNFDVVDAEGSLVSARTSLVGLLTDHQVARIQLLKAVGTLDVTTEFPK